MLISILSEKEQRNFEDECFRSWLNRIDARIDYDVRRALGNVASWRRAFDLGYSEADAIRTAQ